MTESPGESCAARALALEHRLGNAPAVVPSSLVRLARLSPWLDALVARCRHPAPVFERAADWVLDNHYRLRRAVRQVRRDLPLAICRRLPALDGPAPRLRAHDLARRLLEHLGPQPTPDRLVSWLESYQDIAALREVELWALPALLRLVCLERFVVAVERLTVEEPPAPSEARTQTARAARNEARDRDDDRRGERDPDPAREPSEEIGDAIMTLVSLDEIDWRAVVERGRAGSSRRWRASRAVRTPPCRS